MNAYRKRKEGICAAIALFLFLFAFTLGIETADAAVYGADGDAVVLRTDDGELSVPVNAIQKDGKRYLFLPSGIGINSIEYDEGFDASDYDIMIDKNIGSLHFYSDDPENCGIEYINGSPDHSTKASGRVALFDENFNLEYEGTVEAIKGRGNSTWKVREKKPYQIKLAKKANLLNPSDTDQKAKKWILLANSIDPTLIRNQLAYSMAREMGLLSTPEGRQVDLYYDGEYLGVYYLCEKVEIGDGRVEIDDLEKNPEGLTGGYLLEIDNAYYRNEPYYFSAKPAEKIVIKSPEEPTEKQAKYIERFVGEAMKVISDGGRNDKGEFVLFDYFDQDSCVKYLLAMTWISNSDAYYSSTYMYKPADEDKLYFGPVWDCDYSMGLHSGAESYDLWILNKLAKDLMAIPEFRQAVKDEWQSGVYGASVLKHLKTLKKQLEPPSLMNYRAIDLKHKGQREANYHKAMQSLEHWLKCRKDWFDEQLSEDSFVSEGPKLRPGSSNTPQSEDGGDNADEDETETGVEDVVPQMTRTETEPKIVTGITLAKPKVKAFVKKGRVKLAWKKVKGANGYQVRYCRKGIKKKWKYKTVKKRKITIGKLKSRTQYRIQIRAYRTVNGKKYYGKWMSLTKRIK